MIWGTARSSYAFSFALCRHCPNIITVQADLKIAEIPPIGGKGNRPPPWIHYLEKLDHSPTLAVRKKTGSNLRLAAAGYLVDKAGKGVVAHHSNPVESKTVLIESHGALQVGYSDSYGAHTTEHVLRRGFPQPRDEFYQVPFGVSPVDETTLTPPGDGGRLSLQQRPSLPSSSRYRLSTSETAMVIFATPMSPYLKSLRIGRGIGLVA